MVTLACVVGTTGALATPPAEDEYQRVIRAARAGQFSDALPLLTQWAAENPKEPRYLYDYAAVASWAGKHAEAVALWDRLDRPDTPAYVFRAIGFSARNLGKYDVAEKAYRRALQQDAADWDSHAGIALTLLASGQSERADAYLTARLADSAKTPGRERLPLLRAKAEVLEARGAFLDAADTYQKILNIDPTDREAQRGRALMLNKIGAAPLARDMATKSPQIFSADEWRALVHDANAAAIQDGEAWIDANIGPARFAATDRALEQNRQELADTPLELKLDGGAVNSSEFDRIVALRDRYAMQDAIALHQEMEQRGVQVPPYTRAAAADAFLYRQQPEKADQLYRQAIADERTEEGATNPNWRVGLTYALIEREDHAAAQREADALVRDTPKLLYPGIPALEEPNPQYTEAKTLQGLTRLYADQLNTAQSMLADVGTHAPYNPEARNAYGSLLVAREQPMAAHQVFAGVVTDEPDNVGARVGLAETELALRHYPQARQQMSVLAAEYPENKAVQDGLAQLDTWQHPYLSVESGFGRGSTVNDVAGGRDFSINTHLYSSPLRDNWRIFGHWYYGSADLPAGNVERNRAGGGVEYRNGPFDASAEVHHATNGARENGMALALSYRLSDTWRAGASFDSNSNDLPYAAYLNGIVATEAKLTASHVVNESRRFDGSFSHYAFSDGNNRTGAGLGWTERWVSGPVYKFDTSLGIDASQNSRSDAPYFNPQRDATLEFTAVNEWLTWRRYGNWFKQRLVLSTGVYQQEGFGSGAILGARYEHVWQRGYGLNIRYGVGVLRRPFDGAEENRVFGYFDLYWYFK